MNEDGREARQRCLQSAVHGFGTVLMAAGALLLVLAVAVVVETRVAPPRAYVNPAASRVRTSSAPAAATISVDVPPIGTDAAAGAGFTAAPNHPQPPPIRVEIPSAGIDTPVVEVESQVMMIGSQKVRQWAVADYAAGYHAGSARPGEGGNVVLAGHSDWRGAVFGNLAAAAIGDPVIITSADQTIHRYVVAEIHYRKEAGVSLEERLATGQFIEPTEDERVTLVSCWPPLIDDHRLIVVAKPEPAATVVAPS